MPKNKVARAMLDAILMPVYKQLHEARLTVANDEPAIRQQLYALYGSKKTTTDYQQEYFDAQ